MCFHCFLLKNNALKADVRFRSPIGTGFDLAIIGPLPTSQAQDDIKARYNANSFMSKFRGGVQDINFYADNAAAGIVNVCNCSLSAMGHCGVQKNIKTALTGLGVTDLHAAQSDYNTYVTADPLNAETILTDKGHI